MSGNEPERIVAAQEHLADAAERRWPSGPGSEEGQGAALAEA